MLASTVVALEVPAISAPPGKSVAFLRMRTDQSSPVRIPFKRTLAFKRTFLTPAGIVKRSVLEPVSWNASVSISSVSHVTTAPAEKFCVVRSAALEAVAPMNLGSIVTTCEVKSALSSVSITSMKKLVALAVSISRLEP
jgi:hypothetical protein